MPSRPCTGSVDRAGGPEQKTLTTQWDPASLDPDGAISGPSNRWQHRLLLLLRRRRTQRRHDQHGSGDAVFLCDRRRQANGFNNTAILAKYDASGNLQWWQPIGNSGMFDNSGGNALAVLNGTVYVAGGVHYPYTDPSTQYAALWGVAPLAP